MKKLLFLLCLGGFILQACGPAQVLSVSSVSYQSVRNVKDDVPEKAPKDAKIMVKYSLSTNGALSVYVENLTDSIMVIDRTRSFFVNSNGTSTAYYDPTVKTSTVTDLSSSTSGTTTNLGAIGSALGIGGALGTALSGINVGKSSTGGTSVSNTTYTVDQPTVAVGPRGSINMSRTFNVIGVGKDFLQALDNETKHSASEFVLLYDNPVKSVGSFSVTISYSLDGGKTIDKITSNYYVNSVVMSHVKSHGKTNAPLRYVLSNKEGVLDDPWFMLYFNSNVYSKDTYYSGSYLYDYK